jgi:hypothetical protein
MANGKECIIYEFIGGKFIQVARFNACLQKRQRKGGQSAVRIARLAEETRHMYVVKIIDKLNGLNRSNKMVVLGSKEILKMIMEHGNRLVTIENGGYLDFNNMTIKNAQFFIDMIMEKKEFDDYYEKVILYLDTNVDMLDFDINSKDDMDFYIGNTIPFPSPDSKYYSKLSMFTYIGVKYFTH